MHVSKGLSSLATTPPEALPRRPMWADLPGSARAFLVS